MIEKADCFVHTVGTLIDTSITQNKKPGEEGTYEHMNYECARSIGRFLKIF